MAKKNNTSLSALVENYFCYLLNKKANNKIKISPIVEELTGIIDLPKSYNSKKDYTNFLEAKYK